MVPGALLEPEVILDYFHDKLKDENNRKAAMDLVDKNPTIKLLASSIINRTKHERKKFELVSNKILTKQKAIREKIKMLEELLNKEKSDGKQKEDELNARLKKETYELTKMLAAEKSARTKSQLKLMTETKARRQAET